MTSTTSYKNRKDDAVAFRKRIEKRNLKNPLYHETKDQFIIDKRMGKGQSSKSYSQLQTNSEIFNRPKTTKFAEREKYHEF